MKTQSLSFFEKARAAFCAVQMYVDFSISRRFWRQIVFLFLLIVFIFGVSVALMRWGGVSFSQPDGAAGTEVVQVAPATEEGNFWANAWGEFSGSMDMVPELSGVNFISSFFLRFVGAVFLGGIFISTLTNMFDRRVEAWTKGLARYPHLLRNHYLIVGQGEEIVQLVETILKGETADIVSGGVPVGAQKDDSYILIATHGDVEALRERIFISLSDMYSADSGLLGKLKSLFWEQKSFEQRIILYYGDLEMTETLCELKPERAKMIFLLGDKHENIGQDVRNLSCVADLNRIIARERKKCGGNDVSPIPLFVQFDGVSTHSIVQKLNVLGADADGLPLCIAPRAFNPSENWARLLWGFYGKRKSESELGKNSGSYFYRSLDYLPIRKTDDPHHVHLVVVGFNEMGQALVLEALRICHYANFDEIGAKRKTQITVIDPNAAELKSAFEAQHPHLNQIYDIELNFRTETVESPLAREFLASRASDENCLLTVAVCLGDPDAALAAGLNLPEEVYFHYDEDDAYPEHRLLKRGGNSVLIRQAVYGNICRSVNEDGKRYRYVKTFGCHGREFDTSLLCERLPKIVNALYDEMTAQGGIPSIQNLGEVLSRKSEIEKSWDEKSEVERWSNRFQVDSYRVYLSTIGIEAAGAGTAPFAGTSADLRKRLEGLREILTDMEHRRWVAERTLGGFKAWKTSDPIGAVSRKDKVYAFHNCLVSTEIIKRSEDRAGATFMLERDLAPILHIPLFLEHEKYKFFDTTNCEF